MNQSPRHSSSSERAEIRRKYDRFARAYALAEPLQELLGVGRLRRTLLRRAAGRVLEIAAGTGANLRYYPGDCRILAVDLSPGMLDRARRKAVRLEREVPFLIMDGEDLAFPDRSFDTVVSSLSLCTFPDPLAALGEMRRVCRKEGRILLLEHGRSDREWLGRWQDRRADLHARALCCHWNREPLELVRRAGLTPIAARRTFFGILHHIEAAPR